MYLCHRKVDIRCSAVVVYDAMDGTRPGRQPNRRMQPRQACSRVAKAKLNWRELVAMEDGAAQPGKVESEEALLTLLFPDPIHNERFLSPGHRKRENIQPESFSSPTHPSRSSLLMAPFLGWFEWAMDARMLRRESLFFCAATVRDMTTCDSVSLFTNCTPCAPAAESLALCKCSCSVSEYWVCVNSWCHLQGAPSPPSVVEEIWSDPWTWIALVFFLIILFIACWRVSRQVFECSIEKRFV